MNTEKIAPEKLLKLSAEALDKLRNKKPLVMCITNTVVTNWTANVLLAAGAIPAMMEEPEEAAELAAVSGAVLINVGTVTRAQAETMRAAISSCNSHNVPWVLDPVAADKLSYRRDLVRELIPLKPRLIRGNAGEINSLTGTDGIVTLSTGPVDYIGDIAVSNGVPMLTRVTGTGCAQGALGAAFCAAEENPVVAAVATSLMMAIAGEFAFEKSQRPGSFQIALLDALDSVTPDDFIKRGRIS